MRATASLCKIVRRRTEATLFYRLDFVYVAHGGRYITVIINTERA